MQNTEFIKTDSEEVVDNLLKRDNRIIVKKDSDNEGRLYYDYETTDVNGQKVVKRLSIKSTSTVYKTYDIYKDNITFNDVEYIDRAEHPKYISEGSLITDDTNIGIITGVNNGIVTIKIIYSSNLSKLTWGKF